MTPRFMEISSVHLWFEKNRGAFLNQCIHTFEHVHPADSIHDNLILMYKSDFSKLINNQKAE